MIHIGKSYIQLESVLFLKKKSRFILNKMKCLRKEVIAVIYLPELFFIIIILLVITSLNLFFCKIKN